MNDTTRTTGWDNSESMNSAFAQHFRCPDSAVAIRTVGSLLGSEGYFRFGENVVCFGNTSTTLPASQSGDELPDTFSSAQLGLSEIQIPFDLNQVARNLRCEYYAGLVREQDTQFPPNPFVRSLYYLVRPLMSVGFRKILQKIRLKGKTSTPFPHWPVDRTVDRLFENLMTLAIQASGNKPIPFIWFWPDAAQAAIILTHDVETQTGRDFCGELMDLDDSFGFKSAFQVIPEKRYEVTPQFLDSIRSRGFEINVHDLNHDGNLFRSRDEFLVRAKKINEYVKLYDTSGFRSGVLYRNLRWYDAFNFSYDMSVPNVGHLDPQGGGCCTLFPYFVANILEIPVTVTQDYSLFHILDTYSIDLWKQQCELILKGNGMISVIVHPDYVIEEKPQGAYRQLLKYLADFRSKNNVWATVPREIDRWWRQRSAMKLVQDNNDWKIEGEGKERARIAYAHLKNGRLAYSFDAMSPTPQIHETGMPTDSVYIASQNVIPAAARNHASPSEPPETTRMLDKYGPHPKSRQRTDPAARETTSTGTAVLEFEKPSENDPTEQLPPPALRKPLRICMVSYSFYERDNRVMRYAETLAKRGDHVDVFALQRENLPPDENLNGVHLHRLQSRTVNEKSRFSYLARILQFLFRAMYSVSANHLRAKYDLLHIHSVPDFIVFTGLLPRLTGTPVILDIHDILPEFYGSKFGAKTDSLIFRLMLAIEKISTMFSSHVIIANHIWQERLLARSVKPGKCTVVLNCPDRSIFYASGHIQKSTDRFLLLYPGTLNWHQGLDLAIRAFGRISEQVPQADFYIYGDGPSKVDLDDLIRELRLENRVFIRQPLPLREVAQIIESADLGIVPKRKDNFGNEAFSTKILEFMAMGVPVIVSDTQVDRFYFDDSVVRFFRGGEEEDLAQSMLDLIQNAEKRRLLVANATRYVETVDWTAKQHEYLSLVNQLVSKRPH